MSCIINNESNETNILIRQLKRELTKHLNDSEAKFLLQDKKIAELCVYLKTNLSNSIRELLDTMLLNGELDEIILNTITNLTPVILSLEKEVEKTSEKMAVVDGKTNTAYLYTPSLINAIDNEALTLIKDDKHAILIDTARDSSATNHFEFLREKLNNQKIDIVFITHYHYDHIGGLETFKDLFSKECIFYLPMNFSGFLKNEPDIKTLLNIRNSVLSFIANNKFKSVEITSNDILKYDDFIFKIKNSNADAYNYYDTINAGYNAYSMNVFVQYGETKILLPGDSTIQTQDYLTSVGDVEHVNILMAPHHGIERRNNSDYMNMLNPEHVYYTVSPKTWDIITLLNYDYSFNKCNSKNVTSAFNDVVYCIGKNSVELIEGFAIDDSLYFNKEIDVYINPFYNGVVNGGENKPFKSLAQAFTYLPKTNANITIHLSSGIYENIRIVANPNIIQFVADGADVVFKNVILNNATCYFNNINFINNVNVAYGSAYFNNCLFECLSDESGNIGVSLNRTNTSFNNCRFLNCYTGVYAQSNVISTIKNCIFNASAYAIYALCSYVSVTDYILNSGTFRADEGATIQTIDKGASDKRPKFNNSDYMRGYKFFDTKLGKTIFYYNTDGFDSWIDATGNKV